MWILEQVWNKVQLLETEVEMQRCVVSAFFWYNLLRCKNHIILAEFYWYVNFANLGNIWSKNLDGLTKSYFIQHFTSIQAFNPVSTFYLHLVPDLIQDLFRILILIMFRKTDDTLWHRFQVTNKKTCTVLIFHLKKLWGVWVGEKRFFKMEAAMWKYGKLQIVWIQFVTAWYKFELHQWEEWQNLLFISLTPHIKHFPEGIILHSYISTAIVFYWPKGMINKAVV